MTTMDLKPIETVNFNNKLTSRNRKARKSSFGCLSSPLANKKGVPTQQCNINNLFHQKMTYGPHAKPQDHFPCFEDHQRLDKRKLSYGSQPELENSHEYYYNTGKYSRKSSANYEKGAANMSLASTASESDNGSTSELSGFKIVHEGKVIHNESEEELDSPYGECKARNGVKVEFAYQRFASSVLVTGPNVEKISMPTFA